MRPALFLVLPLVLAACATPRESCLSSVGQQGRVIDALISQTRGNVARGYAIEEREELRTRRELCEFRRDDGSIGRRFCNRTTAEDVRVPVTIDIEAEKVKLDQLLARREALIPAEATAKAQCVARYPQ
ncbi:MAG: hypothetical protein ACJASC_000697 [Limimaricola cinnabarinus]|jgi:hypothetical protein|uniref:Lipoprotein n=1 Tax=Limimaricola cinnabarinus LL-001 TaxID=1337093 RepID=U3AME1_9RHOB|nr:hypothetical protein [Limimaricola cinnabarinus]GAD55908.1 hypothetical protein MBELCI_1960 [Limimaricola cinnabarinus LL-001]